MIDDEKRLTFCLTAQHSNSWFSLPVVALLVYTFIPKDVTPKIFRISLYLYSMVMIRNEQVSWNIINDAKDPEQIIQLFE